jgi:hypothetical protein
MSSHLSQGSSYRIEDVGVHHADKLEHRHRTKTTKNKKRRGHRMWLDFTNGKLSNQNFTHQNRFF